MNLIDHRRMNLISRTLIATSLVFLVLVSGATAQPAVDYASPRDRVPA